MSLQVMGWAIEYQDMPLDERTGRTLTSAKVVLVALANHAGRNGEDCFPSVETIQDYTGLSDRMIQYALRRLEEYGTIVKTPDPMVRQSTIGRQDRRPQSYDIVAFSGVQDRTGRGPRGAKSKIESPETGCNVSRDLAPEPVLEPVLESQEQPKSISSVVADAPPHDETQPPLIIPPVSPEVGTQPKARQDEKINNHRPDVEQLCEHLADRMVSNGCTRPMITTQWRTAARLLLDKDGRELDRALRLIDWCQDDEFWRGNILSMSKFRAKYEQLRLQANRQRGNGHNGFRSRTDEKIAALLSGQRVRSRTDEKIAALLGANESGRLALLGAGS